MAALNDSCVIQTAKRTSYQGMSEFLPSGAVRALRSRLLELAYKHTFLINLLLDFLEITDYNLNSGGHMKKLIIVLFLIALITPAFAQNRASELPRLYYINVPIERIIPSSEGYIIQYRNSSSVVSTIGIPIEWFNDAGGKADIVRLTLASDWPSMSVFYSDGEFSHVRLYVHRAASHLTWGNIPMGTDVARFFGDRQSFNIQH
jgi:hypothetical protein